LQIESTINLKLSTHQTKRVRHASIFVATTALVLSCSLTYRTVKEGLSGRC